MQNKNSFSAFIFSSFIYCISCTLVFAQSAALLPNALQVYFDANGNPLTGGSVAFYYPGTFNFKPIWKDSGEVTPWINPITLDAAGRPPGGSGGVYGQGAYRQIVKDVNGNLQWDAVTSSAGSSSGVAATGDGDLVGTVKPWAGITAPNQYQFAYGQQISRTTFAVLFTAITQSLNVTCTSASNTLSGIVDTTSINIGSPVEVSACVVPGTTVSSKTSSAVVMSNPSSVNLNTTATFFPFGNGDGSTTFTLPDFRGNVIAGRPNMGGTASINLTNAFCANPTAQGAKCGSQSQTLLQSNLPNIVPTFTGASQSPNLNSQVITTNVSQQARNDNNNFQAMNNSNVPATVSVTFTPGGTISSINGNVTQTAFSNVQPTIILNYIIKVTPDTNSAIATGVTDINGMTGSIACGTGVSCTGNIITITGSSITAAGSNTQVQFNNGGILGASANFSWVSPTLTLGNSGSATGALAIAGSGSGAVTQTVQATAGSSTITWGNTSGTPAVVATAPLSITTATGNISCSTCGITTNPLSQFASTTSAQLLGTLSNPTGTGLAVFNTSPTLVTPTLGVALATSINGLTLTSSTGTLTIAAAKTLTSNNSITLAGVDASTITFQATDTYVGRATTDTLTNKTLDTAGTGNVFKINGTTITAIGGTTAKVGTVAGALVSGHCVSIDANLNFIDAGGACTTGGGGGTVNSATSGQLAYYGSTGTVVSGNANATISSGALTVGVAGSVQGSLLLSGATSGTTTFAVAAAASGTLTFPAATDTIVGRATTDTLTNKTLTLPVIASIVNVGTLTLPTTTDTLVARTTTDTLTNKTLDTATSTIKIAGTSITSISGNTSKVATTSGALTNNNCASFDASGNIIDNGSTCNIVTTFATRTAAISATIPSSLRSLQTAGYATANDGGAALYTKAGSSQTCGFTSADGAFWQLAGNQFGVKQCGAKGDGSTDDTTALQNAVTWAQTAPQPLLIIDSASSCYKTSAVLNVTAAISIHGVNRDTSYICPSNTSQDAFDINTNAAIHFSNFRINPSVVAISGICINVTGPSQNQRSTISDMFLQSCFQAMYMNNAALWKIDHLYCSAPVSSCVTVIIGGDSTIVNSILNSVNGVIFSPTTTTGGLRIENTKIVAAGSGTGINLTLPSGSTSSDLIIVGGSIENMTNGILLQKGSGTSFTNVNISGTNFENTTCINTDAVAGWLSQVNVSGTICQINGGPGMVVSAGTGWTVTGNTLYGAGTGISIGANMTTGVFSGNTFQAVTTNYTNSSTTATINDQQGMAFASLPSVVANGSQIFVTNGASATSPCTGASTGSTAFRQNGAWKCF